MASKQLNFYYSDIDQEELTKALNETGEVMAMQLPLCQAVSVSSVSKWHSGEHDVILFRPEELDKVILRPITPGRGYYVDLFRSPVIEFSRCVQTNDEILRGRFYSITGFVDDAGLKVVKPPDFIEWTNRVFAIAKKLCKKRKNGICLGRDAISLEALGYHLVSP